MDYKEGDIKVIDIETNGFISHLVDYSSFPYKLKPSANIWCISIRDGVTGKAVSAKLEEITKEWMIANLKGCKVLVAHNGHKYDLLLLRLFGLLDYRVGYLDQKDTLFGEPCSLVDTLVISRLLHPDRSGGHSLDAWGERIGHKKTDFRGVCIEKGYIEKDSPKGSEFQQFVPEMVEYCDQDTKVNLELYYELMKELKDSPGNWTEALRQEHKLADLAIKRESLGFYFDDKKAREAYIDLTNKMKDLEDKIEPNLPLARLNKTETNKYTPPKTQLKKDGSLSSYIVKFADRVGASIFEKEEGEYYLDFEGEKFKLPFEEPVKDKKEATVKDSDHIKQTLIDIHGWEPTEWRVRDMTVDSSKKKLPYKKRIKVFERWLKETAEGKYTKSRMKIVFEEYQAENIEDLVVKVQEKLREDWPVRVPTSPPIKVGVSKEMCPNLIELGDKVEFAKHFADYSTYKDRRSNIAGGKGIEDKDIYKERPEKGYLSDYRLEDNRIATPSREIGASSNRYTHSKVVNIPRVTSMYGRQIRELFCSGPGFVQIGYDFSSLENRIQGHYIIKNPNGEEESVALLAEKPNDAHSILARQIGIDRSDAKSVRYACTYGSGWKKIANMLSLNEKDGKQFYEDFWDMVPALKKLKDELEEFWEFKANKSWIPGIDGRILHSRSKHSLINLLFQSAGAIFAKYVTVDMFRIIEEKGYNIDPFTAKPDVSSMIEMHDEAQMAVNPSLIEVITFNNEEDAKEYKKSKEGEKYIYSNIGEGNNGTYYIVKPNIVSMSITDAISNIEKRLKLKVNMGYDWDVGRNWADCH